MMNVIIDGVRYVPEQSAPTPKLTKQYTWGSRSRKRMIGLHQDLVLVLERAITLTPIDLTIIEGVRTASRQRELYASGASRTLNSRHLTGHAVDIAPLDESGDVSWAWPLYHKIAPAIKQAAAEVDVLVEWGGDWTTFKDGPHWQLPWDEYPSP